MAQDSNQEQKFSSADEAFAEYKKEADALFEQNLEVEIESVFNDSNRMTEVFSAHDMVLKTKDAGSKESEKISVDDSRSVLTLLSEGDTNFVGGGGTIKQKNGFQIRLDNAARAFIRENNFPFLFGFLSYAIFYELRGRLSSKNLLTINAGAAGYLGEQYGAYQDKIQAYEEILKTNLLEKLKENYNNQLREVLKTHSKGTDFEERITALFSELEKQSENLSYDDKNAILQVALGAVKPTHKLVQGVLPEASKRVDIILEKPGMSTLKKIMLGIVGLALIGLSVASAAMLGTGTMGVEHGIELILQSVGTVLGGVAGVGIASYAAVTFFKPPVDKLKDLRAAVKDLTAPQEPSTPPNQNQH